MSQSMTRRSFVKAAAVAGALTAVSAAPERAFEKKSKAWASEPTERKMFVSTCHGCIQACPCRVYTEDGVVTKIEGHPMAPVSQGSLCLKGLNQIHTLYSPRRVLYPLKRTGARGAENAAWERVSWDEALDLAGTKIAEAIEKYGTYAFFTSTGGGGNFAGPQAATMNLALGSPNVFEPGCAQCYLPRWTVANLMYGGADQSMADSSVLEPFKGLSPYEEEKGVKNDTEMLVLWGTQPTISQTAQSGRGMAELRARGCKTVVIDPNMSPDAVKATVWLRVRPGTDTALVLSWYRYLIENKLYDEQFSQFFTNLPFVINPTTNLPYKATDVFPDFKQTTPEDTPAYVCYDRKTSSLQPLEFGAIEDLAAKIDPELFWEGDVNGVQAFTAGQLYKKTAEPFTLERTEQLTWVPAKQNEEAILLYAQANVAGIVHGVASDMQQVSSQMPLGLLGLDMMMGYVNKPGSTLTQNGGGAFDPPAGAPIERPTMFVNNFFGWMGRAMGIGYVIGMTDEQNQARIAALPKMPAGVPDFPGSQGTLYMLNQMLLDRIGMKNHKGLYSWGYSHIPSMLEAIKTGKPYKPRVCFDNSGNKLAMLGNSGSWYEAYKELDFIVAAHPMLTSFHMEFADLVLPLGEWLEHADIGGTALTSLSQTNYTFGHFPVVHLGETVSCAVAPQKVCNAVSKRLNEYMAQGNSVVLGAVGANVGPSGSDVTVSVTTEDTDREAQTSPNASYLHECDTSQFTMKFPLCTGVQLGLEEESTERQAIADWYLQQTGEEGPLTFDELYDNFQEWSDKMDAGVKDDKGWCAIAPDAFWVYNQHLATAIDGLPQGFATESRKCEVYCTAMIKLAQSGWPYCYPRAQEPVDPSIGEEIKAVNPEYRFVGTYSPICQYVEPAETVNLDAPGYDENYPLVLTSGRVPYFHHGTMRQSPYARELFPTSEVRMNSRTAQKYGIEHMDWVEITSRRGSTHARAYINDAMADNVLWMERFWNPECFDKTQKKITGGWRECSVNVLTKNTAPFNEVFGSYTNRGFTVNMKKSTKPEGVWVEPKEFAPFMPGNANAYVPEAGVVREAGQTELMTFGDWDRSAASAAH